MKRRLTLFLLLLSVLTVYAQNSVNVTVNIVPPYSTRLSDYANNPGKTLITLRNTTTRPLDVYLRINITGENGVRVFTDPGYRAAVPVTLQPGIPKILNVAEIQTLFNLSDIAFVGTSANDIERKNGLPEGVYSLCVRAYDFARPTVALSAESPMGCTTLRLTLTEPPILIRPLENEELTVMEPQNTIFSWTLPAGAPPGTLYLLKVVEMFDPNRNPNDAFLSSTGPAFFEKEVMGNTYLYGPTDPPMVKGRKYAWSVKALDKTVRGGGEGTAFRNEGRSEVRSFTPKAALGGIMAADNGNDLFRQPLVQQDVSPAFQLVQLRGKLRYYWMQGGSASNTNNMGNPASGASAESAGNKRRNVQSNTPQVQVGQSQNTNMSLTGNSGGFQGYQNSPLAGVTVQLVEALQFENPQHGGQQPQMMHLLPGNILTSHDSRDHTTGNSINPGVLATAVTDGGGNFSFNVPNLDDLDFGWKETRISGGGGEFTYSLSGRARKVLMIKIGNPASSYYAQPIQFTFGIPGHQDMGTFYSRVKTFNPTVLVAEKKNMNLTKDNMEVLLVRKNPRPSYIPKDEGRPGDFTNPEIYKGYEVVTKATTNANGQATFGNIVIHGDYLIYVRPKNEYTTSQSLYVIFSTGQNLRYATLADYNNPSCFTEGSSIQLAESCYHERSFDFLNKIGSTQYRYSFPGPDPSFGSFTFAPVMLAMPRIYAQVKNSKASNDSTLVQNEPGAIWALWRIDLPTAEEARNIAYNGKWGELLESNQTGFNWLSTMLANRGLPLQPHKIGVTGNDGRIDVKSLPIAYYGGIQKGHFWALSVEKNGFKPAFKAINRNVAPTVGDMSPAMFGTASNGGILYLEPKGEIKVRLVNEEGTPIKGKVHYFDPATGQQGVMVHTSASGTYVTVHVPSGNNRKLMLLPHNTDLYQADTATINVPAGQVIQKDLVVKYKLHRIHFKIEGSGSLLNNNTGLAGVKISLSLLSSNVTMYPNVNSPYINQGGYSNMPNNMPGQSQGNPQNNSGFVNANNPLPEFLGPFDRVTNSAGRADFAFRNAGTEFTFRIRGPEGQDYIVVDKIVSSTPSKNWQVVIVKLKKGRTVKGRVTVGTENSPVAGARIRVKGSEPMIEVFSNAQGFYEMKAVPADTILTFTVSKGGEGLVGLEYTEGGTQVKAYGSVYQYLNQYPVSNQPGGAPVITTINFRMRIYNHMNLNKLLGFPLEVTNLTENSGKVIINGILTIPDTQDNVFRINGTNANGQALRTVDIANTTLLADSKRDSANVPYCKPASLPVETEINEQPITLYGSYTSLLQGENPNGPIVLNQYGSGQQEQGAVLGRVSVSATSFNSNIFRYSEDEQMFLKKPGENTLKFPVFTSSGTAAVSGGIPIVNAQGSDFRYTLNYNTDVFTAISRAQTSRIYKDSVVLDTRLQTSLQHVNPANLDLAIGKVRINSQHQLTGFTNTLTVPKNLPMGRFSMDITRVTGDNSGIYLRGVIHAMGADLPFNNAELHTNRIHVPQGALNVSQLTLLGNIPMEITAQATFGYDGAQQAWYVSVTANDNSVTAASISGQHLNGVNNDARINFSSLWFFSNGQQELFLTNAIPTLTVHNAARMYVQSVELGDDVLGLNGSLDLGIPDVPSYSTGLLYSRTGNSSPSAMTLRPFSMGPVLVRGVRWHFDYGDSRSIAFSQGRITLKGHLESENTRVFKGIRYTLTKTNLDANQLAGNLRTELDVDAGQSAVMGGSDNGRITVSALTGKMSVNNGAWSLFTFDGDMPEEMGFRGNSKRMSFAAENHLSVRSSTIQLKNVETPFGDLTMTYDIQNFRLLGQLHYTGDMEAMQVNADIEFAVDQYGYYFLSAARMTMNNPTVNAQGFLLFGNYEHKVSDRRGAIEAIMRNYSYYSQNMNGELPLGYTKLNALDGFFMEVGAEIPFPLIPNFDIDLGVVSARLKVTIGGDVRLGINFGNSNSYSMGMSVFVNAEFGLGASVGLACAGVNLKAKAGVNMDGMYWSNGNYSMEVSGFISLTGTAYAGFSPVGLPSCDSDCDGACVKEEVSGTIGLTAKGLVTHNNSNFELELSSNSF